MKTKQYVTLALAVMITVSLSGSLWAEPPKMKYTTKIPANVVRPDRTETRLGTLQFVDGVPSEETAQKVWDYTAQEEPNSAGEPEILGLLASIGIQKGKPFAPDARMKKNFTEAAAVGTASLRSICDASMARFRPGMTKSGVRVKLSWYNSL